MPYLSVLEVCSRQGAIQIHVYLYLYLAIIIVVVVVVVVVSITQSFAKQLILDASASKLIPPPLQNNWFSHDLDYCPLTLKTFSAMTTYTVNVWGECH